LRSSLANNDKFSFAAAVFLAKFTRRVAGNPSHHQELCAHWHNLASLDAMYGNKRYSRMDVRASAKQWQHTFFNAAFQSL
jgi:hypothetical protein